MSITPFCTGIHFDCRDHHCGSSESSLAYSRGHKRCTGRKHSLSFVLSLTTRTSPSLSGMASLMRPRGQSPRLTTSPSLRLCFGWNHFFRALRLGRNSFLQRFQNCPNSCWTRCQRFHGLKTSSRSSASGANFPPTCPTRKWFGVSGERSLGSELTNVIGRECSKRSAPQIAVWSSSSKTSASPRMALIAFLALLIIASKMPPKCGVEGGLNFHSMQYCRVVSCAILSWSRACTNSCSSRSAPTKLVPLSEMTYVGVPLLDVIRVNALMNESESSEYDISRCTAHVVRQVKRHR